MDLIVDVVFKRLIISLSYSIFAEAHDSDYIGKTKVLRTYGKNYMAARYVMRMAEHCCAVRGRNVDKHAEKYDCWMNYPAEKFCSSINEIGGEQYISKYGITSIRQVRPKAQLHELKAENMSQIENTRVRPFKRLREAPTVEREKELNVRRFLDGQHRKDQAQAGKDQWDWFEWFSVFVHREAEVDVGHAQRILWPLRTTFIWVLHLGATGDSLGFSDPFFLPTSLLFLLELGRVAVELVDVGVRRRAMYKITYVRGEGGNLPTRQVKFTVQTDDCFELTPRQVRSTRVVLCRAAIPEKSTDWFFFYTRRAKLLRQRPTTMAQRWTNGWGTARTLPGDDLLDLLETKTLLAIQMFLNAVNIFPKDTCIPATVSTDGRLRRTLRQFVSWNHRFKLGLSEERIQHAVSRVCQAHKALEDLPCPAYESYRATFDELSERSLERPMILGPMDHNARKRFMQDRGEYMTKLGFIVRSDHVRFKIRINLTPESAAELRNDVWKSATQERYSLWGSLSPSALAFPVLRYQGEMICGRRRWAHM